MEYEKTPLKICFVGSARYSMPLSTTDAKKVQTLSVLGELFFIGFSKDWFPRHFTQSANFFLLPDAPLRIVRYGEMFFGLPFYLLWLIFRHRVAILVAQSPYDGVAAAAAKQVAGYFGRRVALVVQSHGDFEQHIFLQRRIFFPRLYQMVMNRCADFTLRRADVLHAISNATRWQLEQWNPHARIFQFMAWTDMESFVQAGNTRNSQNQQTILYAGVLTPLKGVIHLINAYVRIAPDFPDSQLILIGQTQNSAYMRELRQQIYHHQIEHLVKFMSPRPQVELAKQMAQARVFVLPSYSEGLGRVVLEAMATGTPVIGTRVGGIPEMITPGETGFLVPPADEGALADTLRWVLEHPQEADMMGQRARQFAWSFFSADLYVEGFRKIFDAARQIIETP